MLNLKEVLDNPTKYPDTLNFDLGDGNKVTLGELRTAKQQLDNEHKTRMTAADSKFDEVTRLATEAARIKADLDKQVEDAKRAGNDKGKGSANDDEFSDVFWNPVRKAISPFEERFKKIDETLESFKASVGKLGAAMEKATTIWADDRWRSQFERLAPRLRKIDKYKNMTFEEVRDHAAKEKIFDTNGLPSVEKAILSLTAESEREVAVQEAFERGKREGETRARLGANSRPATGAGAPKPVKSHVKEQGLEGLAEDVADDKELTEMLANMGALAPEDFGGGPQ